MNHTWRRLLSLAILLLVSASAWAKEKSEGESETKPLFTAEAYLEHVKYLASDELEGRAPGSQGSEQAAQYIIKHLQDAGCEPAGEDGTWFQPFEVSKGKRLIDQEASLEISGLDRKWQLRRDWIPFPFTEMQNVEGPLAFAGYGIQATRYDYDDYEDFDAEGKILLIFRYEPKDEDPEARFGGDTPSRYAFFRRKARTAAKQGAQALLIVNPPNRNPDQDELYEFDTYMSPQTYHLPMAHITREVADAILRQAEKPDLKTLQEQLDQERKSLSQDLGLTVKLRPGVKPNTLTASNVLGMIRGDGTTEEIIVVGAHRDHLGVVPRQFQRKQRTPVIHNGADDNAAGTAGVIELARAIGQGPRPHRNVLFIAFDGEEMGLLGSFHFVRNPTVDLDHVRAMINFDMIGRLKQNKYTVFGTSTAEEFPDLVKKYADQIGLTYKAPMAVGGSDHTPFFRNDIPAMFAFTGVHKQYHQPDDDWELIDAGGAAKILQMWHPILVELANMEDGPTFTKPADLRGRQTTQPAEGEEVPDDAPPDQEPDEQENQEAEAPPSRADLRVRLGVIPDMTDDQPGMLIEGVLDGGAAKAAGMKDGDRIVKIGDEDIRDIYAYMAVLREFEPGDQVDVVVVRNGQKKTLKVRFQTARRRGGDG